jgi:hypothetical protein
MTRWFFRVAFAFGLVGCAAGTEGDEITGDVTDGGVRGDGSASILDGGARDATGDKAVESPNDTAPPPSALCNACTTSAECGAGFACLAIAAGESACVPSCGSVNACPPQFQCLADGGATPTCVPTHGVCCGGSKPAAAEVCNDGKDNDCDGLVDCADSDCSEKACGPNGLVCAAQACACPKSAETCNGADDDCDGKIDNGCPSTVAIGPSILGSTFGGSGGGAWDGPCAAGQALVGFDGRSSDRLQQVAPACAEIFLESTPATPEATYRVRTRNTVVLASHGGTAGTAFSDRCAADEVVIGIAGRSGAEMDALGFDCGKVTLERQGSAWAIVITKTTTGAARGGTGGGPYQYACPTGHVAIGAKGRSGDRIDALAIYCATLTIGAL